MSVLTKERKAKIFGSIYSILCNEFQQGFVFIFLDQKFSVFKQTMNHIINENFYFYIYRTKMNDNKRI